jgi:hypothetical protein
LVLAFSGFILAFLQKMQTHPIMHLFCCLFFFAKCKPTHHLILLFFSVSRKSAYFVFYMGFSFMRKAQIPLEAIATFAWFIQK